jgi:predicted  nucleic acid-binding Zn-ribbon protein
MPTPAPTVTPTPTPAVDKVTAKVAAKGAKRVTVDTKRKLRVMVRALGVVPSGTVTIKLRGAGERKSYTRTLNAQGRTTLRLPKFERTGKVRIRIVYSGDARVESTSERISFTVR